MPPSLAPPDIFRDQLALKYPGYGHALWEPNPGGLHNAVEVGDVGYILHGKFMRLFNALRPADHPSHEKSELPESHEPLKPKIDDYINSCTLSPKNFCSSGVMESTTHAHGVAETSALGPGGPVELSFSCERKRGAALLLPVRVQSEDTDAKGEFAEWMVEHIDDCFTFAKGRHPEIKKMEDIILVTGHHRAKSWANIAFIESPGPGRTGPMQVSLRARVSESLPSHASVDWEFPGEPSHGVELKTGPSGEGLSESQCVFIQGFRAARTHQVLNWFRDRQPVSTSTVTTDPLSSLLEYIASKDPRSDMVLVHDGDLARLHKITSISSLESLQQNGFLACLREAEPKIQRVFSGPPSANDGQKVAILSKELQNPSDDSTPTSGIGRNVLSLWTKGKSKVPRKKPSSNPQQLLQHNKASSRRTEHDTGRDLDTSTRLSAYIADIDYAPPTSPLDLANLTSVRSVPGPDVQHTIAINPPDGANLIHQTVAAKLEALKLSLTQSDAKQGANQPNSSLGFPITPLSPTLLEITQNIKQLVQSSSFKKGEQNAEREPKSEPLDLVRRRSEVRLLMCCALLSPSAFATTEGLSQPSPIKPYHPTGDPDHDKKIALTTAKRCCDVLKDLHSGNDAVAIATKYLELSQALSDLGLLKFASKTSGFALETFRAMHTAAPDDFSLFVASVLSLLANISADLNKDEDAVNAAIEAVALFQDSKSDPVPELVYALLNCAVLLCSVGQKERGAAVALGLAKLLGDAKESRVDTIHISSLCRLCVSDAHIGVDSALALSTAEEVIEISRNSSGVGPQAVLAGALFTKSKVLSAQNQHSLAHVASAEAIALLRVISAQRPVFSLILAHVLDFHSQQLLRANQTLDSYTVAKEAVELWRALMMAAPSSVSPFRRPLAWAVVHQAKFRHKSNRRKAIREELELAHFAVRLFRLVTPADSAGLASALYIVADRMRELDESRDAAPFAEEAVTRLQDLSSGAPDTHALDLIYSLSLASSCLSRTERASDALRYARDAVEEQRDREDVADKQYETHLRQLLRDVVLRFTEMGRQEEALPWFEEMKTLGQQGEISDLTTAYRPNARSGGRGDGEIRKETIYWIDGANGTTSPSQG